MSAIGDRLREAPLPGEAEAVARSWPVVEAALGSTQPVRRRHRVPIRVIVAIALLCVGLAVTLSPAGAWIEDRFDRASDAGGPAFDALPKGGSVLAISHGDAYAISADGNTQHLGSFTDAGWSPHGEHVVGVNGRRVVAVTPTGTIKWTVVRPHRLHHPSWSTDQGFAVAYLEGDTLRAVAGDGTPSTDRRVRRGAAPVTPAWRPRSDRVLTYATTRGGIETVDIATGRTLWRTRGATAAGGASLAPRALAWSRDGRRVVALASQSVTVLDASGRVLRTIALPAAGRELALHPSGRRAAVLVGRGSSARVLSLRLPRGGSAAGSPAPRQLFQGYVDGIAWSQDGRRLLVGSRGADQWLLLGPGDRIASLHGVTRELGARGGFPRVAGWCCSS
jgi:hypothetical protein